MDAAACHADYADARYVQTRSERLSTRNGLLDQLDSSEEEGLGVRVRLGGAWGFAAVRGCERAGAEEALSRALSLAAADAGLRTAPSVALTLARFDARRTDKLFASTEGALCSQRLTECGGGIAVVAVDAAQSQVRSYPASHGGHVAQAGYEHFMSLDLAGHAPRLAEEAQQLLSAPACPHAHKTLILAGEQLGLQIHESIGHAVELDRVLGREASYAGTSFVRAGAIGSLRVGSPLVNVNGDATKTGGLGSFRW